MEQPALEPILDLWMIKKICLEMVRDEEEPILANRSGDRAGSQEGMKGYDTFPLSDQDDILLSKVGRLKS
ncbi:MAG: hypothetical protein ACMUEM_00490 [Flavobacteriales bacterium AspAUS03]